VRTERPFSLQHPEVIRKDRTSNPQIRNPRYCRFFFGPVQKKSVCFGRDVSVRGLLKFGYNRARLCGMLLHRTKGSVPRKVKVAAMGWDAMCRPVFLYSRFPSKEKEVKRGNHLPL
jgi:hypothetical protein